MNCSISDKVPEEPVVSKKSGYLFEKSLIECYISDFGKCPVTDEPLTLDDIVSVKAGKIVKPGPEQAERPRKRPKLEHDKIDWKLEKLPCGTHCYLFNNEFPFGRGIISLVVKAGMLCEENHEAGVAHFLEHLLIRASVEAAESPLSDFSVPQNHEVTETYTEFSFQFHSKAELLEAVKLYGLIASRKVVIKPNHFETERKIVAMEYKQKFETTLPFQSFTCSIIKGASSIERWLDNLDKIDVDIANNFYQKSYLPSNMALLITGSFDIKEILDEAKKSFCVENPAPMFARTQSWTPGFMHFDGVDAPNALVFKTERASTLLQKWGMTMMVNATRKRLEQFCKCSSTIVEDGSNTFIVFSSFYDINRLVYEHLRLMKWGLTSLEVDRELAEIRKQMKQAAVLFPFEEHHQIKLLQSKFLDQFLYGREVTHPGSDVTLSKEENSNLARDALKLLNIEKAKINLRKRSSSSVTSVPSLIEEVKKQHLTLWGDTRNFVDFDGGWIFQSEVAGSVKNLANDMREVELSNGMRVLLCCTTYPYECRMKAFAYGGLSEDGEIYNSSYFALDLASGLSAFPLKYNLIGRENLEIELGVQDYMRTFEAYFDASELSVALKLVHILFCDKFKPEELDLVKSWDSIKLKEMKYLRAYEYASSESFLHKVLTTQDVRKMDLLKAYDFYSKCFSDPSQFTVVLAGDFDLGITGELVERYLGSIPHVDCPTFPKNKNDLKTVPINFPGGVVRREVYHDEPFVEVYICMSLKMQKQKQDEDELLVGYLKNMVLGRLQALLRAKMGEVLFDGKEYSSPGNEEAVLLVGFCYDSPGPMNWDLTDEALKEIEDLRNAPSEADLAYLISPLDTDLKKFWSKYAIDNVVKAYQHKNYQNNLEQTVSERETMSRQFSDCRDISFWKGVLERMMPYQDRFVCLAFHRGDDSGEAPTNEEFEEEFEEEAPTNEEFEEEFEEEAPTNVVGEEEFEEEDDDSGKEESEEEDDDSGEEEPEEEDDDSGEKKSEEEDDEELSD